MRVGVGYDAHRLSDNRKLILGGVEIPFEKGLLGHSDADVLAHAVIDALLGAAGLGDIGMIFPDADDKYKDISSLVLLKEVSKKFEDKGLKVCNIDSIIVAQKPKLSPFFCEMKTNLAKSLGVKEDIINIKATTEEGMGFTGLGEGMAAHAVCIIE